MMKNDDFDRILSEEPEIMPSSGFLGEVMEAVRREAAAPPPIPFPWKRALPGIAAAVLVLTFMWIAPAEPITFALPRFFAPLLHGIESAKPGWILLALLLSFASMKLSAVSAFSRS